MELIYGGKDKMRVAVFFSGGASAMKYLLESDSSHEELYEIVGAFTDNPDASGIEVSKSNDIPLQILERDESFSSRRDYYREVMDKIEPFKADVIILSGYMKIVSYPVIESSEGEEGEFTNKVLNIHPADLGTFRHKDSCGRFFNTMKIPKDMPFDEARKIIQENGLVRAYKGADAVADAVLNGEKYTQSTCHIAQLEFDEGPIVTQSEKLTVDRDFVEGRLSRRDWGGAVEYAQELQEKMKWECDGPAYAKAIELAAKGRIAMGEKGSRLFLDGEELPYCGVQLG